MLNHRTIIIIPLLLYTFSLRAQSGNFFQEADRFLSLYTFNHAIKYDSLSKQIDVMDDLLGLIANHTLNDVTFQERHAFYINAYNLLVILSAAKNYPIDSPMDVPGFFNKRKHVVAGELLTLDELEFEKLMKGTNDPRMHFVLNCAAKSCPTLYEKAIMPDQYEEQLNFSTVMVMDRDDYVKVDHVQKQVIVSKIFEWYKADFEKASGDIRTFINQRRYTSVPNDYLIVFMEYNWTLNDVKNLSNTGK